jgi:hypothetical protein
MWWATLGRWKLALIARKPDTSILRLAKRRLNAAKSPVVSATTLQGNNSESSADPVTCTSTPSNTIEYFDLVNDIAHLIKSGKTNEEIVDELQLASSESDAMLNYMRVKGADLQHLLG